MNLVVSSVSMVDLTNKESKRVSFSPYKNLLTSDHNHLGKSVIMKSIYYTLGAEVYYPIPIKHLNLLTYLDFSIDAHQYRIARLKNTFLLYDEGAFEGLYPSVASFEVAISSLFNLEIDLVGKDAEGTIVKCPPAFYYMPYYIDQENGWSNSSFSFDKMTQFDMPQRKNSFFFHLGVFDCTYVGISKRQKANDRKIKTLESENAKYSTVIETLQDGIDATQMSFDTESLEKAISQRQMEIDRLLNDISKTRKSLIAAEDQLVQVQHDKEILSKYINKKAPTTGEVETELIECPRCGTVFERALTQKLEKAYLIESLHDDYVNISEEQIRLEKRISKLQVNFQKSNLSLAEYERNLSNDRDSYNAYIKSKATLQLLDEYHSQVEKNVSDIERLKKENVGIRKSLSGYSEERDAANTYYLTQLKGLFAGLDIPQDQIEAYSEPGSSLEASGAYGPRCKIAQLLAFVETQKALAPEMIAFPIVIDSPNTLEQDKDHLNAVIHTLFTWDKTDNQVIVASIEGKETASSIPNIKIITLDNEANHLFSSSEYAESESEINEIFTRF